ncbi:hypothetical protein [Spongiactinospora rosea]|uniref:hypothetical protein n=1 Tax=Spongiactinospora rosea TaxID=2248750 RepID=UPI001314393B|nr:hypothetical protein [Spongiactinospora rosea]
MSTVPTGETFEHPALFYRTAGVHRPDGAVPSPSSRPGGWAWAGSGSEMPSWRWRS